MTLKILLVEDHDANRAILKRRLERRGFLVAEAADGAQGIDQFKLLHPDLVLMDISMPNVSGIEALEQMRAPGWGRTPTIALTAHAMEAMRLKCEEMGFDGFVSKPVDFEDLLALIDKLTTKAAAAA